MGQNDEDALAAALALEPSYIGVVSSRTRFKELKANLAERGVAAKELDVVKAPAGLDIGARLPEEIAISILAEIVQRRQVAVPKVAAPEASVAAAPETATDPVCGMTVRIAAAKHIAEYAGTTYYFCGGGCKTRFLADPARYLAVPASAQ
jgi:xanthine dehydrogenase accessory factor